MELAFGLKFGSAEDVMGNSHGDHKRDAEENSPKPSGSSHAKPEAPPPPPPPEEPEDDEAREVKRRKAEAIKQKEAGNEAYKKKDFTVAIECYNKAMELDATDISFLTNRCSSLPSKPDVLFHTLLPSVTSIDVH